MSRSRKQCRVCGLTLLCVALRCKSSCVKSSRVNCKAERKIRERILHAERLMSATNFDIYCTSLEGKGEEAHVVRQRRMGRGLDEWGMAVYV